MYVGAAGADCCLASAILNCPLAGRTGSEMILLFTSVRGLLQGFEFCAASALSISVAAYDGAELLPRCRGRELLTAICPLAPPLPSVAVTNAVTHRKESYAD